MHRGDCSIAPIRSRWSTPAARGRPERLARFILGLRLASNDPMAELRIISRHPRSEGAERVWERQLARFAAEQPYRLLASAETERLLDEMLRLKISERGENKSYQLSEFPTFLKHSSAKTALAGLALDLRALATRANPIYREIISGYAEATALLLRKKTKGLSTRLEKLRARARPWQLNARDR